MPIETPTSDSTFPTILPGLTCLFFVASFHDACKPQGQFDTLLSHLHSTKGNSVRAFFKCDAEELVDTVEKYNVEVVPTVLFLRDGVEVGRVEGAFPGKIAEKLEALTVGGGGAAAGDVKTRIVTLLGSNFVFAFIKGTPQQPKCKFTKKLLEMFEKDGVVDFGTFDVLGDDAMRQGLKDYSGWPTFPQVFAGGKLVGGVDICEELSKDGELKAALTPKVEANVSVQAPPPVMAKKFNTLEDRLKSLISRAPVVLFMKGTPQNPSCGFSSQIVAMLTSQGVEFDSFDILQDDEVRQGLKKFSEWPTYPQLYANGKLVGGLDIVRELMEDGTLKESLSM